MKILTKKGRYRRQTLPRFTQNREKTRSTNKQRLKLAMIRLAIKWRVEYEDYLDSLRLLS